MDNADPPQQVAILTGTPSEDDLESHDDSKAKPSEAMEFLEVAGDEGAAVNVGVPGGDGVLGGCTNTLYWRCMFVSMFFGFSVVSLPYLWSTESSIGWFLIAWIAAIAHMGRIAGHAVATNVTKEDYCVRILRCFVRGGRFGASTKALLPRAVYVVFSYGYAAASFFTVLVTFARLCVMPPNADDLADFFFSAIALFLFVSELHWFLRGQGSTPATQTRCCACKQEPRCSRRGCCGIGCCWALLVPAIFLSILIVGGSIIGSVGGLHSITVNPPERFAFVPEYGTYIHYWCRGKAVNNSVMVLQGGYALPSQVGVGGWTLWWVTLWWLCGGCVVVVRAVWSSPARARARLRT